MRWHLISIGEIEFRRRKMFFLKNNTKCLCVCWYLHYSTWYVCRFVYKRKSVPLWNVLRRAIFNTVYTGTYAFLVILIYRQPYLFTELNISMSEMCAKQFIKESHRYYQTGTIRWRHDEWWLVLHTATAVDDNGHRSGERTREVVPSHLPTSGL